MSAALTRAIKLKSLTHRNAIMDVLDIHFDMIMAVSFSRDYDGSHWAGGRTQALSLVKNVLLSDVGQLEGAAMALSALDVTTSSEGVKMLAHPVRRQFWWKVYQNIPSRDIEGVSILLQLAARTAKLDKLSKRVASKPVWKHYESKKAKPPRDLLQAIDVLYPLPKLHRHFVSGI